MTVSTMRRIHAALLNLAVFSVPLYLLGLVPGLEILLVPAVSLGIAILLCIVVPVAISPGHWMLSVHPDRSVDEDVASGESWITLLLGFLFVQWGASSALYWTQLDAVPLFGVLLDAALGAAISTSWGLLTILAGILFYKLSPVALWLGVGIVLINAADLFVSRTAWIDIHFTRALASVGGTFNAASVSHELTPWIAGFLGVGSTIAILLMVLASRRLTRTG